MFWYKRSKLVFDVCRNMSKTSFDQSKTWFSSGRSRFDHHQAPFNSTTKRDIAAATCIFVVAFGPVAIFSREKMPYSDRYHSVLVPSYLENKLGEFKVNRIKEEFKDDLLPPGHPITSRVSLITKNMTEAPLESEEPTSISRIFIRSSLTEEYPKYLNKEVIVIDRPCIVKACCYDGNVVIFTGLLDRLKSDAEIATIVGHEIGHDVARHNAEKITKLPLVACLRLFTRLFTYLRGINYVDPKLFCLRKQEREADNIGLQLMASAGYDPSVAPNVYKRLSHHLVANDNCSTFPTGSKRGELLSESELMEKAKLMYERYKGGDGCALETFMALLFLPLMLFEMFASLMYDLIYVAAIFVTIVSCLELFF